MKINKLSIENFKCFEDTDFELGKLTLLTGANSSGKSSVLYGILGALQSDGFPFFFSPNGKYVEMGGFKDLSHKHLKNGIVKLGLNIDDSEPERLNFDFNTWWEEDPVRKLPRLKKFHFKSKYHNLEIISRDKGDKYTLRYENVLGGDPDLVTLQGPSFDDIFQALNQNNIDQFMYIIKEGVRDSAIRQGGVKKEITLDFNNFDELEKSKDPHFHSMVLFLKEYFNKIDQKINFISSFRLHPERTYYETTKRNLKVGKFGEDYINQVILWQTENAKEYKELVKIMKDFSLMEDIQSRRLPGGRFELVVKVNKNSVPASLNDVGFGISQFLPVIVADVQLGKGGTLFVAQPEIHLHPSVQAQLGNYMCRRIKEADRNYVIETHSEYLLNRIRLAIVKGEISTDDVRIYYLQNDGKNVRNHKLEFTTDGRILNAPEDFFKTYMMDVMDIAVNAE